MGGNVKERRGFHARGRWNLCGGGQKEEKIAWDFVY